MLGTQPQSAPVDPAIIAIVVLLIVAVAFIFVWQARIKIARRNAAIGTPRERINEIKTRARMDETIRTQEAELLRKSREFAALLDNKAERLEQLLMQADERIAQLHALHSGPRADRNGQSQSAGNAPAGITGIGEHERDEARTAPEPSPPDPLTARVYELADQGRTPIEIARELDEHTGKVELMLALRATRSG